MYWIVLIKSIGLLFVDMYVVLYLTIFNSIQRVKKENTSSFEIRISSFLIIPSYLLKKKMQAVGTS